MGIALNLEEETVGVLVLGDYTEIDEGEQASATGRIVEVPVGEALIGRVVDALGEPIDGKGPINTTSLPDRAHCARRDRAEPVNTPVQSGIKAIDAMTPIGRGQRQLIIGDRSTGKSAIALDTIINQRGGDLICIYVAIGQKQRPSRRSSPLEQAGAMEHTIVVAANASDPRRSSTSRRTPGGHGRGVHGAGRTRSSSTTTFPSTPGPTARSPC